MKSIILLVTDTFRYDNLGNMAERPVRTPELDRFAERATSVESFYMGSFPTIPHRTDLTGGILGWPHYPWQDRRQSGPNHAPAILRQAGYVSQLICDCPHLFNAGFQHGFDAAFQHRGQEGDGSILHLNDPIEQVMPPEKTRYGKRLKGHNLVDLHRWTNRYCLYEAETFPAKTAATAVRWLEENWRAGPFFLWVDFFDPHEPWDPPEYVVRRYDPDYASTPMLHPNYGRSAVYTDAELHNLWAHYAAEAELVDRYIGRVLQKIDDLQLWDDVIVLVTSDHGTSLGEHGRTGKSNINPGDDRFWPIYPEIGHVPFLLAGSDIPKEKSLDLIAQPIDILPTLLELAGASVDPEAPFEGESFAQAVLGGGTSHREYAVSGCYTDPRIGSIRTDAKEIVTPFLMTERWGYAPVGAEGEPELYDVTTDPLAAKDVSADNAGVVAELQELFLEHLREHDASEPFLALWTEPR